ncbi:MAG: iron-containing alcohol dehydrogenase [Candidatus Poribacteria bacterium]|nr:iron-containing alcohol dehydrogenase [Candidatus Poribacteria bacterium]MDE0505827.1 iron-containing alcohol dehydrogenase [Candidatus Poribacteria bacterium]
MIPPTVITGAGAAEQAGEQAKRIGASTALVVTDNGIVKLGYADELVSQLRGVGIGASTFSNVTPDPTLQNVNDGLKQYRDEDCDLIISIGGGSAIDCGKAIAIKLTNDGELSDFMGVEKVPNPGVSLIAIPTTAGTGSECTKVTVITDIERNVKMMLSSPCLMARVAIVDPLLSLTTPPHLTSAVGVDALTHAIEAYISKRAQPITDALALEAIRMISGSLRQAWADGENIGARTEMIIAASIAGMAFSNSSVALVHGMSRPIGAYFHVHHGLSNAVLLLDVMEYSVVGAPNRFADIARAMGEPIDGLSPMCQADAAIASVERLVNDLQMPRLREIGIDKTKFEAVVDQMALDALASGSPGNNPRQPTKEEIVALYHRCFQPRQV